MKYITPKEAAGLLIGWFAYKTGVIQELVLQELAGTEHPLGLIDAESLLRRIEFALLIANKTGNVPAIADLKLFRYELGLNGYLNERELDEQMLEYVRLQSKPEDS